MNEKKIEAKEKPTGKKNRGIATRGNTHREPQGREEERRAVKDPERGVSLRKRKAIVVTLR